MQIERVIGSTAGLYGDLQGIVGKAVGELNGLTTDLLVAPASIDARLSDDAGGLRSNVGKSR